MKVLALTPLYLPFLGGIEVLVSSLADTLVANGIETIVVTDDAGHLPSTESLEQVRVYRLKFTGAIQSRQPGEPLAVLNRFREIVASEQPDIIHMHCATGSSAWYVDRLLKGPLKKVVPFIITQHGVLEAKDRMNVIRDLLRRADAITAVSSAVLASALTFAATDNGYAVIPNGIRELPSLALARRDDQEPYQLVCVGRLQPEKGFDLAIGALSIVRAAGLNAVLSIIGHGEERQALLELASTLGVSSAVHLLGPLDNLQTRSTIANSSLLLAPSRTREGFGLVVAEAAMAGVPSIVTEVGGLPETVSDGVTGLVVQPDSPEQLAEAIKVLLTDTGRRIGFGMRAKDRALERYGLRRCAQKYADLYRAILAKFNA